jgi:HD-GYP domain-containing protein (c-di-GMP phosphodiesterase class II)
VIKSANSVLAQGDIPEWASQAVASLLRALRMVDVKTYEHCLRVGRDAFRLARAMGLTPYQQRVAEFSGILHDIGKMGVSGALIHKASRLTSDEMTVVASHPILSEQIVQPLALKDSFFQQLLPGIRGHHERVDGTGYPDNLVGDQIPLIARLILVVDTLDAMGQDRAYRKALPLEAIYLELKDCSSSQFDPALVKIFLESHKFWKRDSTNPSELAELLETEQRKSSSFKVA